MELYQFFWLNQQKEHLTEIIQNAENLTFVSGTANTAPANPILPLPTQYYPCPPTPSRTPILFRFLTNGMAPIFALSSYHSMPYRRLQRDILERGRDIRGVLQQYERFVKPSVENFIDPSMMHADIIIPRGGENK